MAKLLDVYDLVALNLGNLVAKVVNLNQKVFFACYNLFSIKCLTLLYCSANIISLFGTRKLIRKKLQHIKHFIFNVLYVLRKYPQFGIFTIKTCL